MWDRFLFSLAEQLSRGSTRAFIHEAQRTPGYSFKDWLHGYIYGRWPYLYIGIGKGDHPAARWIFPLAAFITRLFPPPPVERPPAQPPYQLKASIPTHTTADGYHGKAVPLEAARQLVMVNEPIRLAGLENVIPYVRAREIVLQHPDHIAVIECPCRSGRADPCLPLDVCLVVGEPFASFVVEHNPHRSRRITPEQAVAILKAEDERGHVHHAFFKDAMLGRFYAICNCCACCCGAMNAHQHGTPMLASSGYVCKMDEELCISCETCAGVCQFGAITVQDYLPRVDESLCMGCGLCVQHCDQGALALERDPRRSEPLEIYRLLDAAG